MKKIYSIKNNNVWEVEKIDSEKGIVSFGKDKESNDIIIQNLDAGDAVALMRIALEDQKSGIGRGWIYGLGVIFCILIVYISYVIIEISSKDVIIPQIIDKKIENTNPIVSVPIIDSGSGYSEKQIDIEEEREDMMRDFQYQTLTIEHSKANEKIKYYENIEKLYEEEVQKNKYLNEKIVKLEENIIDISTPNLTREGFLKNLGEEVYDRCEKLPPGEGKDECKNLFYNFLKDVN